MHNTKDQLTEYIKGQLELGIQEDIILDAVKANGWTDSDYYELSKVAKTQLLSITKPQEIPTNPKTINITKAINETKKTKPSFSKKFFIIVILTILSLISLNYIYVTGPCLNQISVAENKPLSFDVVFKTGSNMSEILEFANDLKEYYQGSVIKKIASEDDYVQNALKYWGYTLKTQEEKTNYIKMISAQAMARITIEVQPGNLKTLADFNTFADNELKKYPDLVLERSSGVGGIDASAGVLFESSSRNNNMRLYCFHPRLSFNSLMHIFTKAQDLRNIDNSIIRSSIASARVNASMYYERNNSYDNFCENTSDDFGLKTTLDYIKNNGNTFVYCSSASTTWIFAASVKSQPDIVYCTDEKGYNSTTAEEIVQNTNKCN